MLQGVTIEDQCDAVGEELLKLAVFEVGTVELALEAALNCRRLRAAGRTVCKAIDTLIASFCLLEGYALLHNNRDYDPFEEAFGLKVVHP